MTQGLVVGVDVTASRGELNHRVDRSPLFSKVN